MVTPQRDWLTIAEVAELVGRHDQTIRTWARNGELVTDHARKGRMIFVWYPSVRDYMLRRGIWKGAYELPSSTIDMGSSDSTNRPLM